ncbi:hypothetical protein [Dyadobacter psychrotolerans]|uniref:Uncharacterized protein n=1 Tax=Dyadobacter psychrotolerans TaxID=2541721 RepID=A0A4R5D4R1_9BACT|nr:hypothetical protein [Dyadobacter psychrotolerans]TDE08306.1 hypothetical protein E0F88_32925 [Dyadobacter psychrotolerans]
MLSPKTKRKVALIVAFGILWFIFSMIYCMLEKGILGDMDHYPSTGNQYKFAANIFVIPALVENSDSLTIGIGKLGS